MNWLRVIALALGCAACASPSRDARPGAEDARFQAAHDRCVSEMYAARRARGAPDWSVYDYCMAQRGYRRSNRPA